MSEVEVRGLQKRYGDHQAVADVSFSIRQGEVVGLLGPNGAGKTTTVEILEGFRQRSGGEVRVLGMDPSESSMGLRRRVGIVLQSTSFDRELTVMETIDLYGRYYPRHLRTSELLEMVGLEEQALSRVSILSGGQRRRLDLAVGIVGDPDLIFLDEPTTGFDPAARREAWELIRRLRRGGKTILLTTHYLDEAQSLCDRVIVLVGGRIIADADPQKLGDRDSGMATITFRAPSGANLDELAKLQQVDLNIQPETVSLRTNFPTRVLRDLLAWADRSTLGELPGLTVSRPTLEDTYLELTTKEQQQNG